MAFWVFLTLVMLALYLVFRRDKRPPTLPKRDPEAFSFKGSVDPDPDND